MGDCVQTAKIILHGSLGKPVVDGVTYSGVMTPQGALLDDEQVAAVASYVRQSWGNDFGYCSAESAAAAR
jgi:mono/diheme cytochrome c family protein